MGVAWYHAAYLRKLKLVLPLVTNITTVIRPYSTSPQNRKGLICRHTYHIFPPLHIVELPPYPEVPKQLDVHSKTPEASTYIYIGLFIKLRRGQPRSFAKPLLTINLVPALTAYSGPVPHHKVLHTWHRNDDRVFDQEQFHWERCGNTFLDAKLRELEIMLLSHLLKYRIVIQKTLVITMRSGPEMTCLQLICTFIERNVHPVIYVGGPRGACI